MMRQASGILALPRSFIYKSIRGRKLRSVLSISGIVFGVTILVAILLTNETVNRSFSSTMEVLAAKADLQAYADWAGVDPGVLTTIRGDGEVEFAAPVLEVTANLPRLHEGLLIVGIDFSEDPRVRHYSTFAGRVIVPDLFELAEDNYALIVSDLFLKRHNLSTGDSVHITTPQGLKPFNVRGFIETEGGVSAMSGNWALMKIDSLRAAFEKSERPSRVDIFLKHGADAEVARARLSASLGATVQVDKPWMRSRPIEKMIGGIQITLTMLGFVALLVGIFLIYNTISISVIERCKDMGILRACGATRRQILSIFLLEGLIYGTIGSVIGTLLGILAARASISFVGESISSAYFIFLRMNQLHVEPVILAVGLLSGVGASVAGAFYPALAASRMVPLEAILRKKYRSDIGYSLLLALRASVALVFLAALTLILHYVFEMRYMGYLFILLIITTVALSSPLTVAFLATMLSGHFSRWFGIEGRMAIENTLRNPTRTGFTAAALIIGLAIIINTSGAINGLRRSIGSWVENIFSGDIIIAAHNPFTAGSVSAPLSESLVQDLLAIEGVERISAIRYAKVEYSDHLISLLAVDGEIPGGKGSEDNPAAIHVSKNFAELFRIKAGDRLSLTTKEGLAQFEVLSLIEDYNYNWPKGTIIVNREAYKKYWGDSSVDQIILYLGREAAAEPMKASLTQKFADRYNLTVFSNREFRDNFMGIIDQQFSFTYAQLFITVLVVLFAVTNTLLISILSRRAEIGILRAVGATKGQNQRIVFYESAILGAAGILYGTLLGLIINLVFVKISLPEETGWTIDFSFPFGGLFLIIVVALVVSIAGSILPAREIGRMAIPSLVRHEQ